MHRIIYVILSLAMCATLLGCPAATDQTGKVIDETFFKDLPPQGTEDRPGWIISVVKKGRLVYQRASGMADMEKEIPITSQTAFDVATLSRYFTGATVALLMENGAFRLEDDIRTYIPEMPKRIELLVNGFKTVDYTEPDDSIEQTGVIGLQIHGGGPSEAWYKDIRIKQLPGK